MIRVKDDSVNIAHLTTGALLALYVADQVYSLKNYETVITSGNDAKHSKTSLHYSNNAFDLRTRHMRESDKQPIADDIKVRLGQDFDVVLEHDHLHIECQPRRRL